MSGVQVAVLIRLGHRELWVIAMKQQPEDNKDNLEGDRNDHEDGSEDADDDDDDNDDEEEEENSEHDAPTPQHMATSHGGAKPSTSAFGLFLEFVSTTCPAIPHLTYPLLLVVISTLPTSLLPLQLGPTSPVQILSSHLWSPVDAQLLSTHALPGQPSAFQAFLRDITDCIIFLIGKSLRAEAGETAEWLVGDQLGARVWKEGVLELGGKSAGRRAPPGTRQEGEASIFGQALARLFGLSSDLGTSLLEKVQNLTLDACSNSTILPQRVLPIITAVRDVNTDLAVLQGLDELITMLAAQSLSAVRLSPLSAIIVPHVGLLVETIKSYSVVLKKQWNEVSILASIGLIWQELYECLQQSSSDLIHSVSPGLFVSFISTIAQAFPNDLQRLRDIFWPVVQDVSQETRFALTRGLLKAQSPLLTSDSLDSIIEEATQVALTDRDSKAVTLAASCIQGGKVPLHQIYIR